MIENGYLLRVKTQKCERESEIYMITTSVCGRTAYLTGNFYHYVRIYRNNELVDTQQVMCCEDEEEASYYAVSLSKELTQEEKENYMF